MITWLTSNYKSQQCLRRSRPHYQPQLSDINEDFEIKKFDPSALLQRVSICCIDLNLLLEKHKLILIIKVSQIVEINKSCLFSQAAPGFLRLQHSPASPRYNNISLTMGNVYVTLLHMIYD